jgi:four helix bundle protein
VRHENTIVYSKCIELMQTARDAITQFPKGFAFLAEQLRKNTASTTLNFAEGYYHQTRGEQRRYFGYAIQSAREASATFDSAHAFRLCRQDTIVRGKALALDIVKILSKWGR